MLDKKPNRIEKICRRKKGNMQEIHDWTGIHAQRLFKGRLLWWTRKRGCYQESGNVFPNMNLKKKNLQLISILLTTFGVVLEPGIKSIRLTWCSRFKVSNLFHFFTSPFFVLVNLEKKDSKFCSTSFLNLGSNHRDVVASQAKKKLSEIQRNEGISILPWYCVHY